MWFSVKLGAGMCISSYMTIYLRQEGKLGFSYSSIEYTCMYVKSNKTVWNQVIEVVYLNDDSHNYGFYIMIRFM